MLNIIAAVLPALIDDFNATWFLHIGFLARNIFYVSDEIKVVDFETLKNQPLLWLLKTVMMLQEWVKRLHTKQKVCVSTTKINLTPFITFWE